MKQCDKVILFGYLDGFTYESGGLTNHVVALETGERVEIPVGGVVNVNEFVEKNKIKLKDVIERIKKLDLGTQKVWLNEILNELGSDYGTLKYKAGYEQGKLEGSMIPYDEPQKVTIPQFVADWIEYCKTNGISLGYAIYCSRQASDKKAYDWITESFENQETFALAWINGYTVEEKRYLVKAKINSIASYFNYDIIKKEWFFHVSHNGLTVRTHHTRKELEEAGFEEVFNSPLFEVEEVTE